MSGENWTPGPWRIGRDQVPIGSAVVADGYTPANSELEREHYGGNLVAESLTLENARLTAAAPELYEALKEIYEQRNNGRLADWVEQIAPKVLAKARGEET